MTAATPGIALTCCSNCAISGTILSVESYLVQSSASGDDGQVGRLVAELQSLQTQETACEEASTSTEHDEGQRDLGRHQPLAGEAPPPRLHAGTGILPKWRFGTPTRRQEVRAPPRKTGRRCS